MMRLVTAAFGIIAGLPGGPWPLQGLGVVHLRPILCFADCAPVQGPTVTWAAVGAIAVAVCAA
jgi:hypothetical protein